MITMRSALVLTLAVVGCRGLQKGDPWDPDLLLRYQVQLDPQDWAQLRHEGRSLGILAGQCNDFVEYTRFRGLVHAGGVRFANAEIRKKGALGSLSATRPSLKLDFGQDLVDRGRRFRGERWFTLNNDAQDPSHVRQCLAYSVFEAAGLPTPRCNLAKVSIQSFDKGVYTHVESIKGDFLLDNFGNELGKLYEIDNTDFNGGLRERFIPKLDLMETEHPEIDSVIAALAAPIAERYDALDAVVDMDEFLTFAAAEALVSQVDGYTASQNNSLVYSDPDDGGRFHFIVWGPDQTFRPDLPNDGLTYPNSVFLENELMFGLWEDADFRQRYDDRMRELLDTVWDEDWLKSEARRWGRLAVTPQRYVDDVITFIDGRRDQIVPELGTERSWPSLPRRQPPSSDRADCAVLEDFTLSFDGTAMGIGENDFDGTFEGDWTLSGDPGSIRSDPGTFDSGLEVGLDTSHDEQARDVAILRMWREEAGDTKWVSFVMTPEQLSVGSHPLHGFETFGVFGTNKLGFQGFVGDGTIEITRLGGGGDEHITGTVTAKVIPQ